ncbi:universal stress protein [Sphaerisporangium sp. NPDC051017]|uniref:universal stress protein n=1 Tax=Sphaerisporangium sp. NPDC051017 TaxID=3154636 RepID=UPI003417B0C6
MSDTSASTSGQERTGKPIVVGVDGSESSLAAAWWAAEDALRRGAAIRLVHVREPRPETSPPHLCDEVLDRAVEAIRRRSPAIPVTPFLATGEVVGTLRQESENAVETVIGSRGTGGFAGLILGSVGLGLAGHAADPVVVVRRPAPAIFGEIVVGVDGSAHSEAALEYAFEQARLRPAKLHAVYTWPMPMLSPYAAGYTDVVEGGFAEGSRRAWEFVAPWRDKYPDVEFQTTTVCGYPVSVLTDVSRTADLLVVGSRGLGAVGSALLGSVSHGVLHHAHCPVAIVRPHPSGR